MTAEWRDIWTVAYAVVARQPTPVPIFVWLGVAFFVLMIVEGLRASFLPRRFRREGRLPEAMHAKELSPSSMARAKPEPIFVRAQRSGLMRNRKLVDTTPRRHQAFRPKIRRITPSSEMTPQGIRDQLSDSSGQGTEWDLPRPS